MTPFGDPGGAAAAPGGEEFVADQSSHSDLDAVVLGVLASLANPEADSFAAFTTGIGSDDATAAFGDPGDMPATTGGEGIVGHQTPLAGLDAAAPTDSGVGFASAIAAPAPGVLASQVDPAADSFGAFITDASIGSSDATPAHGAEGFVDYQPSYAGLDAAAGSGGLVATAVSFAAVTFAPAPAILASLANPAAGFFAASITDASIGSRGAIAAPVQDGIVGYQTPHTGFHAAAQADGGMAALAGTFAPATSAPGPTDLASLANPPAGSVEASNTDSSIGSNGATAAQVQQALDESGLSVNGTGITVGVLSDSFNDLGGAAADEADGALPPAADIDVLQDLPKGEGGTDEGRAMMQIIHDIAPGAKLDFYTAFDSEQDFANGILALAAAGCKVIVDDVGYYDEPFFQNGVVAQAIQTVEAEGVTYVTAAGNDAENAYQANTWTPITGSFSLDGKTVSVTDAENFGSSATPTPFQTITVSTEGYDIPLLLEWNQAYGTVSAATADLEMLVYNSSGTLVGTVTNASNPDESEPTNPWVEFDFTRSGTYYVVIENLHTGTNPGLFKEITEGDGLPVTISGANVGSVYGHSMTPGAITAGAVSTADTPAFGVNPAQSESFSSSGAGTELLFANNGTALSSPDELSPVAVSGVDNIHTTVSDLSDFYGTSAAAASLAGVAALILSADPSLTPAQVEAIMEQTALPMANSAVSGAGLVQVDPAVADALSQLTTPTPTTPTVTSDTVSGSGISGGAGTLTAGETAVLTLAMSEAVTVSGGVPTLTLNDGGSATYEAAQSTPTSLVFDYTVAAGQYTNSLAVTGINLNGATVTDAGNAANFAGADTTFTGLLVDATTPVTTADHAHDLRGGSVSVAATSGVLANDSDSDPSDILSVSAVNGSANNVGHSVTGAYGTLTLNSSGSYSYANTNSSAVTAAGGVVEDIFNYTVSNGHGGTANSTLTVLITSPSDTYVTGAHGSTIKGGTGTYVLDGSAGDVNVTAGSGTQWLVGGPGDTLTAGSGADTFMFAPSFGKETINNFNTAQDVIDLPLSEFANFAAVEADMHASGANTVITLDANDTITLSHITAANLHAQNFHFVV